MLELYTLFFVEATLFDLMNIVSLFHANAGEEGYAPPCWCNTC
jgi:hypothetical protein